MDDWEKAGRIAAEALEFGKQLVKTGNTLLETAEKTEEKMASLGGKPACPVNISINHVAAHYTPYPDDNTVFKEGDLVKLDVTAQINGAIGDVSCTIDLGDNNELVKASEEALNEALKMFTPGTKIGSIGKKVQETINMHGFTPLINLSGHQVDIYKLHAGITIPNYDNKDPNELKEGEVFAVEPFATNGEGRVVDGKPSSIYRLDNPKPVRDIRVRQILKFIAEEYKGLPFAKRWLAKKFPHATYALTLLENQGILYQYPQLPEKSRGLVSQAEHTVVVGEKPKVTTKI